MDPGEQCKGHLKDYPLTNYPDYEPGHPPRSERLDKIGFLDEVEKIWGSRWGGSGGIGRPIGVLRKTGGEDTWKRTPTQSTKARPHRT
jgi:hypothetical protein